MQSKQLIEKIIYELEELKADDIVILDVQSLTDIADFMIIASSNSNRHSQALMKNLVTNLKQQDIRPFGVEDDPSGSWILVDYADVIVHIMLPATREFYQLEKLWNIQPNED